MTMDARWKSWLRQNIDRGCDVDELREILRREKFSEQDIDAEFSAVAGETKHLQTRPVNYERLAHANITKVGKRIETDWLQLYVIDQFMTAEECDTLVGLSHDYFRPSTVTTGDRDKYFRTSSTCDLYETLHPLVRIVDERIAKTLGINLAYAEVTQIQHYAIGQEFKAHTDYFEPNTPEYMKYANFSGNRTWTFMVYLTDTPKGGGTCFVNIDKTFYPKKGQAVVWNNLYADGQPNHDTLHWGQPVEEGTKVVITKWFREQCTQPMFTE